METILGIAAGLVGINLIIILHELGHFIVAKRNGVVVEEFGLGLPPRLASRVFGRGFWRCRYSLNWLPIGGFVRLQTNETGQTSPGSFEAASFGARLRILLAGVGVNFLMAAALLTFLATVGLPRLLPAEPLANHQQWSVASDTYVQKHNLQVDFVDPNSVVAGAGLVAGDRLLAVDNRPIASLDHLQAELIAATGPVELQTDSGNFRIQVDELSVNSMVGQSTQIGVSELVFEVYGWSAPITGVMLTGQYTWLTLEVLGQVIGLLLDGSPSEAGQLVHGPVGLFQVIGLASGHSWELVLMVLAIISLSAAIINLLPIPALDGGQALLVVWSEKIRKKPLSKTAEKRLQWLGMAFLLTLAGVLIFLVDLPRLLG